MPRLAPKPIAELATYDEMFGQLEEFFGFLPNDYLTMGHKPAVMKAVVELTGAVLLTAGKTSMTLRLLVMYVSSRAAGCMYCTAHCAGLGLKYGLSMDKVQNIRDYQTHPSFSAAERAALTVADKANKMPNAVTDEDFGELGKYFEDEAIAEIVSLIAMMSFYNKWNDTLATTLEKPPLDLAASSLSWWNAGKHIES
ncbi:carboxymuconolactone decarboxylase family protein [Microcoleus sp. PH2017_30_WIL_O_A]|jgi:alkylhydroperoxidase family enzyme|uniref:carboxymuconolactone decarboxylase family protein n=1 Tax=Microcoleus sp. PH2017_30_WIL_O_A TaxID=2798840 RepID=UPI001DF34644|nr:carboxymuconolactone decarboxylase family protein [Microcoleus sp. PH2017_30_WIL_O_A]MCC3588927.1 carboxymuconolactone decarboxylase family protein [Microcoleus sp. PH2017_30_WIL_O_A]